MSDWYLYLLRCHDGSFYTGISTDVARRFAQHQREGSAGSKHLKGRGPLTIVFQMNLGSKGLALKVERKVKKLSKAKKEELIKDNARIDEIVEHVSSQSTV